MTKLISKFRLRANFALLLIIVLLHLLLGIFGGEDYIGITNFYQDITGDYSAPLIINGVILFCCGCAIMLWVVNIIYYARFSGKTGMTFEKRYFAGQLFANILVVILIFVLFLLAAVVIVPKIIAPYIEEYEVTIISKVKIWVPYIFTFLIVLSTSFLQLCIMPPNDARSAPIWLNSQWGKED
ncbi:MAG: hypothetical protein LBD85_01075 [Oscillospiraceae bacterium]|jgi:hypothetical protein|nr:hypothetical protein [Oscillospiraceae bacterium]